MSLAHTMPSRPPEHHLPSPLFPLCRHYAYTTRDRQPGPCDALIYFLCFLRFLRNGLGVKTSDWWGRWLDQVNAAPERSKSSSRLSSLCSTQPTKGALRQTPPYFHGEGNLHAGGPVSHHQSLRTECARTAASCSCARSV
jgi:hypothetical protein